MKEKRYFNYKKRSHTAYNCFKREKTASIPKTVSENSNSQGKKLLLPKLKKRACLFLQHLCLKTSFVKVLVLFNIYKKIILRQ